MIILKNGTYRLKDKKGKKRKEKKGKVFSRKLMSQLPDETEYIQRTKEMMEHGRIAGGKITRKGE
jgi:hypothetical protein